ncbi:aminopeptidase [Candidatus Bathyarchaeota archaeon]|nr:MAG: aminopeptidase [Candidatus Bathyarchaeota archaeon]
MRGARIAVETCMAVGPDEEVLIVTDTGKIRIAEALAYAARSLGAETSMIVMLPRARSGVEPPRAVAEAMLGADVILMPTTHSLSHTEARRKASEAGARIASMPGITEDMMSTGAMTADYEQVAALTEAVAGALEGGREVHLTTPSGTDLRMSIEGRKVLRDTGLYHKPGDFGNLPAGEACLAPVEGTAEGILVIDRLGDIVTRPLRVRVEAGRAVEFEGPDADRLVELLRSADENAYNIAELGIGTNPKARLRGVVLEDEKVLGTVHVALGDNRSFPGGRVASSIHLDCILLRPTLTVDGRLIMKNGRLLVSGQASGP